MLPLTKLVYEHIGNDKAKTNALIRKMGFTNLNKGWLILRELLAGRYTNEIALKLGDALGIDLGTFIQIMNENRLAIEIPIKIEKSIQDEISRIESRKNFRPSVTAVFEKKIEKIFNGHELFKTIFDRDILALSVTEQLTLIKEELKKKYWKYYTRSSLYKKLGRILTFDYYFDPDYNMEIHPGFLEIDYDNLEEEKLCNAYWISPDATVYPVANDHIDFIMDQPELFNISRKGINGMKKRLENHSYPEDELRYRLLKRVIRQGWIRCSIDTERNWFIQVWNWDGTIESIIKDSISEIEWGLMVFDYEGGDNHKVSVLSEDDPDFDLYD